MKDMARSRAAIPKRKDFWGWPPVLAFLFVVAVLLSVSTIRIFLRASAIRREENVLKGQIRKLEAENARLKGSLQQAGSREVVERMAKEKLNLKQLGEEVVVVTPEATTTAPSPSRASTFGAFLPALLSQLLHFFSR